MDAVGTADAAVGINHRDAASSACCGAAHWLRCCMPDAHAQLVGASRGRDSCARDAAPGHAQKYVGVWRTEVRGRAFRDSRSRA
eukprot:2797778-Prymnesium_polylepis.1